MATGNFTGAFWAPIVPPGFIPPEVVPVAGKITIVPATISTAPLPFLGVLTK
jgi:hypothetical protein